MLQGYFGINSCVIEWNSIKANCELLISFQTNCMFTTVHVVMILKCKSVLFIRNKYRVRMSLDCCLHHIKATRSCDTCDR